MEGNVRGSIALIQMDDLENENKGFSKPSFDGRLEYYKVMKQYMMNIAQASSMGDFVMWYRMLNGMFAIVKGFIRPVDAVDVRKKLDSIKRNINMLNSSTLRPTKNIMFSIDFSLQSITEDLYVASKHLLLPVDLEEMTDISEDDFLGGSE